MTHRIRQSLAGNSGRLVALLIGLTTIAVIVGISMLAGGSLDIEDEWGILLFQALVIAAPFGALATAQETGLAAWLTAGALTAMIWGLLLGDALLRRGEGGANIGLGLLLLVSPLIIAGGAFIAAALTRRRR